MKKFLRFCVLTLCCMPSFIATAQVPVLNSYPSASSVIYLDFDGHIVSGTSWNYNGPFVCEGSGLTPAQITEIFDRVSEDYRPFNINITTDSTLYRAAPINKRMRVVVTVSSAWYGSAGGVAFTGSFTWGDDSPAFVFSALLNYNTKNIAEAVAHEAGHTLGLYHQAQYDANCAKISDYYSGTGSGEIGWAPIMGVGYYRNFTLWHNGSSPWGCADYQNDLAVITSSSNGFGYRTDDHGSTFETSTTTQFINNQFSVQGVIERNTDTDLFSFIMLSGGRFNLDAVPYNVGSGNAGSDLDLQVSLYDQHKTLLAVYNPGSLLSSVIDTTLNNGIYYLQVEGRGNLYAPAYASLGSYALRGTLETSVPLPLRTLQLSGLLQGDNHKLNWLIDADEQVIDQVIEFSTDGRTFNRLTTAGNDDRTYTYRPAQLVTTQYRVVVTFDNGRRYYSNVITIRQHDGKRPQVAGNIITGNEIRVNSPGKYAYTLIDYAGRTIAKGQLVSGFNTIQFPASSNGLYIIRFANEEQQWTDKLLKQ